MKFLIGHSLAIILGLILALMILQPTMASTTPKSENQSTNSSLSGSYSCPEPALCIKHCQETGYKNGICTGHGFHDCQCVN
ncbi:uncharacterized protein LOC142646134 [Dermatophagoides pteronyssinus]|uniref:uncharacterized protein LOC142646134 n=1 Tax=Dermatophagoides pteronyssinus TaxID=6956 RepID=UPI003F6618BC